MYKNHGRSVHLVASIHTSHITLLYRDVNTAVLKTPVCEKVNFLLRLLVPEEAV